MVFEKRTESNYENEEGGALEGGGGRVREEEEDGQSIVRLEYLPRRSWRDGKGGRVWRRKGILIRVRRDTAKRA